MPLVHARSSSDLASIESQHIVLKLCLTKNINNENLQCTILQRFLLQEGFLRAKVSMAADRTKKISLWTVPPKSPDLNPVEMFWGWLRRKLRLMDLEDLRKKRRPLGRTAYTARIKGVLKSQKAQTVAKNFARRLRQACKQVDERRGPAADN